MSLAWPVVALVGLVLAFSGWRQWIASKLQKNELETQMRLVRQAAASDVETTLKTVAELEARLQKLEFRVS